jgi:MFS superfamily sulfate permease-like transporter
MYLFMLSFQKRNSHIGVWLPKYNWGKFMSADLIAAVSVAALLIPESMDCATVAGVPVQIGPYADPLAITSFVSEVCL